MAMFDSAIFDGALFDVGSGGGGGTNLFNPQLTDPPPDWEGFNVTITGGATDSSGGTTAVAIRETAGNTQFNFGGGAYVDIPSGETLTLRFRLKSVGSRSIYLLLTDFDLFSSNAVFDMVSITATPGSGVTASITAAGVGFYDIELSYVLTTDVTAAAGVYGIIRFMDDTGSESYAGNTSSGFDIESASLSLDSASPPAAATLAVSSASITLTGGPVAIRAARKLPVVSRSITTTGQAVTARYGRKVGVSSASVALSGGSVGLTYAPAGAELVLPVDPGALLLSGGSVGASVAGARAPAEVNWPGTSLSKDEFRARQRAILARIIAEEREERQKQAELAVKPVKKAAKKAARRIIRKAMADGILSGQAEGVETQIIAAMTGSMSLSDVLARVAELEWQHLQQIAAFEDRVDEEAAAILLLAA